MKISKDIKGKYFTDYSDKTEFASNARLLQSIWRTEKGFDKGRFGNYLNQNNAIKSGENFLTIRIFELVKNVVYNNPGKRKVIQQPRIWTNLLSSQPMAFNLFGELTFNLDLCRRVFEELYPERKIKIVNRIEFEYSPGRRSEKYTNDNSAFDVFIEYVNNQDENCFFGIEVKYAEDLNDKPSKDRLEYTEVAEESNVFKQEKFGDLKAKPLQQIWRDHLLTLSMFIKNDDYKVGDFIYLYPTENKSCRVGVKKYTETFNDNTETYFKPLTLEKLVGMMKKHCTDNWISEFEDRYLNFGKIKKASL
jgi:hypothetical protein